MKKGKGRGGGKEGDIRKKRRADFKKNRYIHSGKI